MSRTRCGNEAGGSRDRRARRAWLVERYRADVDVITLVGDHPTIMLATVARDAPFDLAEGQQRVPATRCFCCGRLLTAETMTVDRIVPAIEGGTYVRTNIRPACQPCQTRQGNELRRAKRAAEKAAAAKKVKAA